MKRIWLIGNGVSLKTTPLYLLRDEVTMGCNKIGKLGIALTYYVKQDHARFDVDTPEEQINPFIGKAKMLLWNAFRDGNPSQEINGMGDLPDTTWISRCDKHHYYGIEDFKAAQSWHLPELCTAYNTISLMAQWAVLLGFDEIFLIGCDADYTDGHSDHFDENYYSKVDDDYARRNSRNVQYAHHIMKRSCPIPIYDATVNGKLDIHPKVEIERILSYAFQKES